MFAYITSCCGTGILGVINHDIAVIHRSSAPPCRSVPSFREIIFTQSACFPSPKNLAPVTSHGCRTNEFPAVDALLLMSSAPRSFILEALRRVVNFSHMHIIPLLSTFGQNQTNMEMM
jgi:hypothetical protein